MIFQHTWEHVLDGTKTQTRRIVNPQTVKPRDGREGNTDGDWMWRDGVVYTAKATAPGHGIYGLGYTQARKLYRVGDTHAVQPGRGKRAVWYRKIAGETQTIYDTECPAYIRQYSDSALKFDGWQPLRIKITAIRRQDVRQISEADALAEGGYDPQSYLCLWANIHDKKLKARFDSDRDAYQFGGYIHVPADNRDELLAAYSTRQAALYDAWVLDFERVS